MSASVHFFGLLTDTTGSAPVPMPLPEGASVQNLLDAVFHRWPALQKWDASLLIAINQTYARRDEIIPPDAEIAIMPPVQGG